MSCVLQWHSGMLRLPAMRVIGTLSCLSVKNATQVQRSRRRVHEIGLAAVYQTNREMMDFISARYNPFADQVKI